MIRFSIFLQGDLKMQYTQHKNAIKLFKEIDANPQNYLIIHYSCESFYDINDGHTPRITSIAICNYSTAQKDSFSIHKVAEKEKNSINDIEDDYDRLEQKMLDEFFTYAKEHSNYFWIHWNMRDINYGFKAIEHRYAVLGGTPYIIPDEKKIDLSRLLINCYGVSYIEHPRMEKLMDKNKIKAKDYLTGQQEAKAFCNKEYVKLHMSTLRKVDVFSNIMNRAINNNLKVNSKWKEIYGFSMQGIFNFCKDTWWIQLVWSIFMMVLGAFIGNIISIFL